MSSKNAALASSSSEEKSVPVAPENPPSHVTGSLLATSSAAPSFGRVNPSDRKYP